MGIAERKLRQKEEVRGAILKAAWETVKADGWQALTIRRIADAIEYSVPVVYNHFESKDAILHEFSREGFSQLTDALTQASRTVSAPGAQLRAMALAYWRFAFTHREYYQLMFGLGIPTCEVATRVAEIKQFSDVLLTVLDTAIAAGRQPAADRMLKFHTFWSILHGMVAIQMMNYNPQSDAKQQLILEDAVHGFIKGLME